MTQSDVTSPMRLLVVDDHEVVRQGLVALLERREAFQVVAEAGTVAESIEQARRHQPDIVIMDVRLPDGSGIEACRAIRAELPNTRVVMLTSYPDEEAVLSAIVAGASGYLPAAGGRSRLVRCRNSGLHARPAHAFRLELAHRPQSAKHLAPIPVLDRVRLLVPSTPATERRLVDWSPSCRAGSWEPSVSAKPFFNVPFRGRLPGIHRLG